MNNKDLPEIIKNNSELEEFLTRPSAELVEMMKHLDGDIMILGVTGKIGPDLARTAIRAIEEAGVKKRVIGVSRFSNEDSKKQFEKMNIELLKCDLLNPENVKKLPQINNVIYLVGKKFGTQGSEELTWMINTVAPANAARHFSQSKIVALSTGCVYPLIDVDNICLEETPVGPVGEYAQSCLGRERVFEYHSKVNKTPTILVRLSYAVDLRYGVLYDIGKTIMEDNPIDLKMSYFNTIWQGDVNNFTLLSLEHCESPASILNMTRPEIVFIKDVAEEFGKIMNKKVTFTGEKGHKYFLSDVSRSLKIFGEPSVSLKRLMKWQAHWLLSGGRSLNIPTHYEENQGDY